MTHRNLNIYLLVSVIIILSGITWVVFTQVDHGAYYSVEFPNLSEEHHQLIQKIYQLPDKKIQEDVSKVVVEPVRVPAIQVQPSTSTVGHSESDTTYYLRNNPWSPHYKPGNI